MAARVRIYTRGWCGYCTAALRLLRQKGVVFDEIDVTGKPELRRWLVGATRRTTVPQIFIDDHPVGGYTDIAALDERGMLDRMLSGAYWTDQASSASG
jgi:glutaredoxin 3